MRRAMPLGCGSGGYQTESEMFFGNAHVCGMVINGFS